MKVGSTYGLGAAVSSQAVIGRRSSLGSRRLLVPGAARASRLFGNGALFTRTQLGNRVPCGPSRLQVNVRAQSRVGVDGQVGQLTTVVETGSEAGAVDGDGDHGTDSGHSEHAQQVQLQAIEPEASSRRTRAPATAKKRTSTPRKGLPPKRAQTSSVDGAGSKAKSDKKSPKSGKMEKSGTRHRKTELSSAKEFRNVMKNTHRANDSNQTLRKASTAIRNSKSAAAVLSVFDTLRAYDIKPTEALYMAALVSFRKNRQSEKAIDILESITENGVKCSRVTFNALIGCCAQARRFEDALRVKDLMAEQGVPPDSLTYTAIISACRTAPTKRRGQNPADKLSNAEALFKEMKDEGIEPVQLTYNTLIDCAVRAKNMEYAAKIFTEMEDEEVEKARSTFELMLLGYSNQGDLNLALDVFRKMKSAGVARSVNTYNLLFTTCARSKPSPRLNSALGLLREMLKEGKTDETKVDEDLFEGEVKKVEECPKTVRPNTESLKILLSACKTVSDGAKAEQIFTILLKEGVNPDLQACNLLLNALMVQDGELGLKQALALYERIYSGSTTAKGEESYLGALFHACGRNGPGQSISTLLQKYVDKGAVVTPELLTVLLECNGGSASAELVEIAWPHMINLHKRKLVHPKRMSELLSKAVRSCFPGDSSIDAALRIVKRGGYVLGSRAPYHLQVAVGLVEKAISEGMIASLDLDKDPFRCDLRHLDRTFAIVLVMGWLSWLRQIHHAEVGTLVVCYGDVPRKASSADRPSQRGRPRVSSVTASDMDPVALGESARILLERSFGLRVNAMRSSQIQALTVEKDEIRAWLASPIVPGISLSLPG